MNWNREEGRGGEGQSHGLSLSCYDGPGGQLSCLALELGSPGLTSGLSPYQQSDSHMFSNLPKPRSFSFGCAGSSLLHGLFSSCSKQGLISDCGVQASCSSQWPLKLWSMGSRACSLR